MKHLAPYRLFATCILCLGLTGATAAAQESLGLSLPMDGQMSVWDMRADPPAVMAQNLPESVVPGLCYAMAGNKLTPKTEMSGCLDYYTSERALNDLEQFSATGQMSFNDFPPDYAFRGLELQGVEGIETCGERENCDVLYIAGFANAELTAKAMKAARDDQVVKLTGRKTWNAESIDIIVESIEPIQ